MGCGFKTFFRRDLVVRVHFLASRTFFRLVQNEHSPIKSNSAAIVDSFLTILEVCPFGPANQQGIDRPRSTGLAISAVRHPFGSGWRSLRRFRIPQIPRADLGSICLPRWWCRSAVRLPSRTRRVSHRTHTARNPINPRHGLLSSTGSWPSTDWSVLLPIAWLKGISNHQNKTAIVIVTFAAI